MKMAKFLIFFFLFSGAVNAQILNKLVVSKNAAAPGNSSSLCPVLSGDSRYTIFESDASNLVSGDTNGRVDLFLYDKQDSSVKLISKNSSGALQSGGDILATCASDLSRDGTTAVYATSGAGLVDSAQTNVFRIYGINLPGGEIELLTPGALTEGVFFPSVSEDGKRVVFVSNDPLLVSNGTFQVFLLERPSNTIRMISVDSNGAASNAGSTSAAISHDGKWVVFPSKATNLKGAELASTGGFFQIYLLNIESGQHKLISADSSGTPGNKDSLSADLSADGNEVVFFTEANNLVSSDNKSNADVLLYDKALNKLELVALTNEGQRIKGSHELLDNSISADGSRVMFRSLLGIFDKFRIEVYVRDRANSRTYLSSFDRSCAFGEEGGDSHSGSIAPDAGSVSFAIGKGNRSSPFQILNVDLDVLQSIAAAPSLLDQPDADVCANTAIIAMTPYTQLSNSSLLPAIIKTDGAKADGITYENRIKAGKSLIRQINGKKNILALKDLKPGNYSSTYRVKVTSGSTSTNSPFSKPVKFTIK